MADSPFNDAIEALEEVDRQLAILLTRPEDLFGYTLHHVEDLSCRVSHALEKLKPGGGAFTRPKGGRDDV